MWPLSPVPVQMTAKIRPNSRRARRWHRGWLCAVSMLVAAGALAQALPERPIPFERLRAAFGPVSVVAVGDSACHRLDVLLADTPARRARGLMFVERMPADAGMLFVHRRPAMLSMWMKNTLIPLDMLFADREGRIINIAHGTPLSTDSIRSEGPASYVLELNAGRAAALGLDAGARLIIGDGGAIAP